MQLQNARIIWISKMSSRTRPAIGTKDSTTAASLCCTSCEAERRFAIPSGDAFKIFQLYVRGGADWVDDHVRRAIDKGVRFLRQSQLASGTWQA